MEKIEAKQVIKYRGYHEERLIYSWKNGDEICQNIGIHIQKLERHFRTYLSLRVEWDDLRSYFILPDCITMHTVFYIRDSLTMGTITDTSFEELKYFFDECNKVELVNYFTETLQPFYRASEKYFFKSNAMLNSEPKMKIVAPGCVVYQFFKPYQPRKSKIFNN